MKQEYSNARHLHEMIIRGSELVSAHNKINITTKITLSKSSPELSKSPHLVVISRRYHGTDKMKGYDCDTVLVHQYHHALTKTNPYGTVSQTLDRILFLLLNLYLPVQPMCQGRSTASDTHRGPPPPAFMRQQVGYAASDFL